MQEAQAAERGGPCRAATQRVPARRARACVGHVRTQVASRSAALGARILARRRAGGPSARARAALCAGAPGAVVLCVSHLAFRSWRGVGRGADRPHIPMWRMRPSACRARSVSIASSTRSSEPEGSHGARPYAVASAPRAAVWLPSARGATHGATNSTSCRYTMSKYCAWRRRRERRTLARRAAGE